MQNHFQENCVLMPEKKGNAFLSDAETHLLSEGKQAFC